MPGSWRCPRPLPQAAGAPVSLRSGVSSAQDLAPGGALFPTAAPPLHVPLRSDALMADWNVPFVPEASLTLHLSQGIYLEARSYLCRLVKRTLYPTLRPSQAQTLQRSELPWGPHPTWAAGARPEPLQAPTLHPGAGPEVSGWGVENVMSGRRVRNDTHSSGPALEVGTRFPKSLPRTTKPISGP